MRYSNEQFLRFFGNGQFAGGPELILEDQRFESHITSASDKYERGFTCIDQIMLYFTDSSGKDITLFRIHRTSSELSYGDPSKLKVSYSFRKSCEDDWYDGHMDYLDFYHCKIGAYMVFTVTDSIALVFLKHSKTKYYITLENEATAPFDRHVSRHLTSLDNNLPSSARTLFSETTAQPQPPEATISGFSTLSQHVNQICP